MEKYFIQAKAVKHAKVSTMIVLIVHNIATYQRI